MGRREYLSLSKKNRINAIHLGYNFLYYLLRLYVGWTALMSKSPRDSILGHYLVGIIMCQYTGYNFPMNRFAKYYQTAGHDSRDLIKAYGILFKVEVTGTVSDNINLLDDVLCFIFREERLISLPSCSSWDP